jgi:hypothetical protein
MNEDDTFRILKRIPFDDMYRLYDVWWNQQYEYTISDEKMSQFLEPLGWTLEEAQLEESRRKRR